MKEVIKYIPSLISLIVSISIWHQFYIKVLTDFEKIQTWSGSILYIFASFILSSIVVVVLFIINLLIYHACNSKNKIQW